MKPTVAKLILAAAGVAFLLATPGEAAKRKHRTKAVTEQVRVKQRAVAPRESNIVTFSNSVIGADPDPNIRHQLLRDLSGFFGGDI